MRWPEVSARAEEHHAPRLRPRSGDRLRTFCCAADCVEEMRKGMLRQLTGNRCGGRQRVMIPLARETTACQAQDDWR
jgi:hypothetical protein